MRATRKWPIPDDIAVRLQAIEHRLEIQQLAAMFSDAVNERDVHAFGALWAEEGAVWTIGEPLPSRAKGHDAIVRMLEGLFTLERYFMQLTHAGVITIGGDRATARFAIREHGRGTDSYYDNLAIYDDRLVREPGGWRFLSRTDTYRFVDQEPFRGQAYPVAPR